MIDLKFGKYGIRTADKLNIILYELVENKKEDSKNYGEVREKVLGYYGELEHALNSYTKIAMADDDFNATTVEEVKDAIYTLKHGIRHECSRLMLHRQMLKNEVTNNDN